MDPSAFTTREVAAVLGASETTAWRWLRKHRVSNVAPGRWSRSEVLRLKASPAARIERKAEFQAPPADLTAFLCIGQVRRMLNPQKPVAYETAHRILDRAGIAVLRVSRGVRLVSREAVERYLAGCVERPGTVALSRHDRVARSL
jgi:predicted DNA-binding transcriptional regulator AlpA